MSDDLPRGWQWAVLGDLCENHDGIRVPVKASDRLRMRGQYPYYGASGVIDHVNDYLFDGKYLLISEDGANLLARRKPIAFEATGRFWVNNHAHVVTALSGIVQRYLMYAIEHSDIAGFITGSAQPKITQRNLSRVPVPVPPTAEQERIAAAIDKHFSHIAAMESALRRALHLVEALRLSQLGTAFHADRDLPPGWSRKSIDELCDVTLGQSPPGSSYNDRGEGSPFLQGKAEFGDRFPSIKKWTTEPKKHATAGSVLLSVRAPVGPTNVAPVDCAIGRGLAALRPRGSLSTEYLLWAMRQSEGNLVEHATGSTFEAITSRQLRSHSVAVAPPKEQERIVAAIEEHFSRLDTIESVLRAQPKVEALRKSIMRDAFTGRLVPHDSNDEPASFLLKRIAILQSTTPKRHRVRA